MGEDYPRTLMDLEKRFASEEGCCEYLFALRWPQGFVCPRCGERSAWAMSRGLWLCQGCRRQVSVTSGTIFQDRKLPVGGWAWGATRRPGRCCTSCVGRWCARGGTV